MIGMTKEQFIEEAVPLLEKFRDLCTKYDVPMVAAVQLNQQSRSIFHHPTAAGNSPFGEVVCVLNGVDHPDDLPPEWTVPEEKH